MIRLMNRVILLLLLTVCSINMKLLNRRNLNVKSSKLHCKTVETATQNSLYENYFSVAE